jgi:Fur family ferric uptake transcriptional regulator
MGPGESREKVKSTRRSSDDLRATVDAYLRKKGLHSTKRRSLILDEFLTSHEHVTLDEMAARVKARDASVGFTTVYRTLRLLVECGVAEEHQFGDRMTRYELKSGDAHHDHLICTECGRIIEFQEPRIEALQDAVAARFGFRERTHKLEIYGECAQCLAKGGQTRVAATRRSSGVASGVPNRPRTTPRNRKSMPNDPPRPRRRH